MGEVTRILVIDDQPVLLAGLATVLRAEPGLVPIGTSAPGAQALAALERSSPDVVLLAVHLPAIDELVLTRRIKRRPDPPRVVLYAPNGDEQLHMAAALAGADGVVSRRAGAKELFDAIRMAARGELVVPEVALKARVTATSQLESDDLPIFSMLLDATPPAEVAALVGLTTSELSRRIDEMLSRLTASVAA